MTKHEFYNRSYGRGDVAVFYGRQYLVASVDFEDEWFELCEPGSEPERIIWTHRNSIEKYMPALCGQELTLNEKEK